MNGYHIGIDPGTKRTALAAIDHHGHLRLVMVINNPHKKTGHAQAAYMIDEMMDSLCAEDVLLPGCHENDSPVLSFTVEAQEIYNDQKSTKGTRSPKAIMLLALVAGALICICLGYWREARAYYPAPKLWKGQQTKFANQKQTLEALGLETEKSGNGANAYSRPTTESIQRLTQAGELYCIGMSDIKPGEWKDLGDAIGLARWGKKRYDLDEAKAEAKKNAS